MLHHFWVIDSLFPIGPMPAVSMDPRGPGHWASNESRVTGALAELYAMIPQDMHEMMATYKQFGSVVRIIILATLSKCRLINNNSLPLVHERSQPGAIEHFQEYQGHCRHTFCTPRTRYWIAFWQCYSQEGRSGLPMLTEER